jgi:1-acyl-sn-glycerol-3-phosphate acyltransferase
MAEVKDRIDTRTKQLEAAAQQEFQLPMLTSDDIEAKQGNTP